MRGGPSCTKDTLAEYLWREGKREHITGERGENLYWCLRASIGGARWRRTMYRHPIRSNKGTNSCEKWVWNIVPSRYFLFLRSTCFTNSMETCEDRCRGNFGCSFEAVSLLPGYLGYKCLHVPVFFQNSRCCTRPALTDLRIQYTELQITCPFSRWSSRWSSFPKPTPLLIITGIYKHSPVSLLTTRKQLENEERWSSRKRTPNLQFGVRPSL